jgi:hypothetical protein
MKNDSTTTALNLILAALVFLGVLFALLSIWRMHNFRRLDPQVRVQLQQAQIVGMRAQQLLQETITYNETAKSPELAQIIKSAQTPPPAAK